MEGIYKVIIQREVRESIEQQRRDMIAACYANPNWDGKENSDKRSQYLKDINDHFNQAISAIYAPPEARQQDVDWDNPFYAAHRREIERTKEQFQTALDQKDKTAGDVLSEEEQQARENGRGEIDQIPRND